MIDLTSAWMEWHENCALDLCSEEHIDQLSTISNQLFKKAMQKLPEGVSTLEQFGANKKASEDSAAQHQREKRYTFHLMETELLPSADKAERQQYKEQIFARAAEPGMVTGYFLRDFFRSFVKTKANLTYNLPENTSGENDEDWEEKIQSQHGSPWAREDISMEEQIDLKSLPEQAEKYWNGLTETEKAALCMFSQDMTMSNSYLLEKVGVKKSVFCNLPYRLIGELNSKLSEIMEEEERRTYIKTLLYEGLPICYQQWEQESELGQWIRDHFTTTYGNGKKVRFCENSSGKKGC